MPPTKGDATREKIIATATRLFTEDGYDATSIEDVLTATTLSRGALYHHFPSKKALFTAVLEATEAHVCAHVADAAAGSTNPLDGLRAGSAAWLALARDPTVRQIVLLDAPSVVGWQAWREIEGDNALGQLRAALGWMASLGRLPPGEVNLYAHMLLAMLIELSLLIARSDDPAAIPAATEALETFLSRLAQVAPHAPFVPPSE